MMCILHLKKKNSNYKEFKFKITLYLIVIERMARSGLLISNRLDI